MGVEHEADVLCLKDSLKECGSCGMSHYAYEMKKGKEFGRRYKSGVVQWSISAWNYTAMFPPVQQWTSPDWNRPV